MKHVKEHTFKPGDKVYIDKEPPQWSSDGKYPLGGTVKFPTTVTIDRIFMHEDSGYSSFVDTDGYGWTAYDYFELVGTKELNNYEIY